MSFPLRLVIDVIPAEESEAAAKARAEKHAWLVARDYRVVAVAAEAIKAGADTVLGGLAALLETRGPAAANFVIEKLS